MEESVIIIGDIHGRFGDLNALMNKLSAKYERVTYICCGDFAFFWDKNKNDSIGKIKVPERDRLIWIPGNHENWNHIDEYERGKLHEVDTRVFLASFGAIETINNKRYLFVGGAESIDRIYRIEDKSWWKNEIITEDDMNFYYDDNLDKENVDVVISHTCPTKFKLKGFDNFYLNSKFNDPSKQALTDILENNRPADWFFGHYHKFQKGKWNFCNFTMLNKAKEINWWIKYE